MVTNKRRIDVWKEMTFKNENVLRNIPVGPLLVARSSYQEILVLVKKKDY